MAENTVSVDGELEIAWEAYDAAAWGCMVDGGHYDDPPACGCTPMDVARACLRTAILKHDPVVDGLVAHATTVLYAHLSDIDMDADIRRCLECEAVVETSTDHYGGCSVGALEESLRVFREAVQEGQ